MIGSHVESCEQPATNPVELTGTRDSLLAALLLCTTLIAVFWGFLQLDLPLARYMRSLHVPWLERAGNVGNRLGSGVVLVGISSVLLVTGLMLKHPALRRVGLESLLAHAFAGLAAQALKHVIGRPRPRLVHGDSGFLFGPSFDPGLDSFPSGHASASFAVATVFARHFPRMGWMLYSMAALVALSRIVRGSHFPTDVMAGVSLGLLAGCVITRPLRAWRHSLLLALTMGTPFLVTAFTFIWIAVYPSFDEPMTFVMLIMGMITLGLGITVRLYHRLDARRRNPPKLFLGLPGANVLIGSGLALTTGSRLVTIMAVFVGVGYWLMYRHVDVEDQPQSVISLPASRWAVNYQAALTEVPFAIMLPFGVLFIQQIKGLLPLLS